MESTSWCSDEFSEADFGDKRLSSRLVKLVDKLSEQPTNPINQSCQSWSETKAAYRFLKNEKVNCAEICKSHSLRTKERARQYDVIISASDKSFFNYDGHKKTDGLGPIGKIQKHCTQGLVMHTAFAVTTTGLPLGILDQKIWAREKKLKQKKDHWRKPIDQKESNTWLLSLKKTTDLMADMKTKVVTVADREADIYEYIVYGNKIGANFIVRAAWSRSIVNDNNESVGHLWDYMATKHCAGLVEVVVPEAKNQLARTATVEIFFSKVNLKRPKKERFSNLSEIPPVCSLYAVWVKEKNAPQNAVPLEWMLLTNLVVENFKDAMEKVDWYKLRWTIEVFHKILKSGCQVEACRLQTGDRLKRYITICSIIAWRLHWMTFINRTDPQKPCTVLLENHEWKALYGKINKTSAIPNDPPTVRVAVRWIAMLGGFLARKNDGEPGIITIWRGWQRLSDIADDFILFSPT